MASNSDIEAMALFCDFENLALGVRDAGLPRFDIRKILERLLVKGSIVVKKAYCDWDRYKDSKAQMHETAFEMIEIPHLRMSGKNSADIRMVVDALDLCYTKAHVDTFVILSGDSDFSPLVSKLRENNKTVIGVGVKQATSDLLVSNCDEFIFYDDLVRAEKSRRTRRRRGGERTSAEGQSAAIDADGGRTVPTVADTATEGARTGSGPSAAADAGVRSGSGEPTNGDTHELPAISEAEGGESELHRRARAIALVVETLEALTAERGEDQKVWGSMVKQTLRRRQPGFNESYYGYSAFSDLLEDAARHGLLTLERDEKSGGYIVRPVDLDG
jgi:uncharacterized protein (TIGR00288 family)